MVQSRVSIINQSSPGSSLGQSLGRGLGSGLQALISQKVEDMQYDKMQRRELDQRKRDMDLARDQYQDLVSRGFSPKEAALWTQFTTGGQTELAKQVLDRMAREEDLSNRGFAKSSRSSPIEGEEEVGIGAEEEKGPSGLESLNVEKEGIEVSPDGKERNVFEDLSVEEEAPIGRTPKEKVALQKERDARSFERNKKYLDRLSEKASGLVQEELALSQMRGALDSGDFGGWRNSLGEFLPGKLGESVKNASAQTVNAAAKQYLMSSLKGLTGRPNQFIEQQITKALVNPLYREEANELILQGLEGMAKIGAAEVEIAEELEEKYINAGKEIPRNFQQIVRKKLKAETDKFNSDYEQKVREKLGKQEKGVKMYDRSGNLRIVPKNQVKKAEKSGYKFKK